MLKWTHAAAALVLLTTIATVTPREPARAGTGWTALFVYSDGRVVANEQLENEQTCDEAVCAVRYGRSCEDQRKFEHEQEVASRKAKEEREKKIAAYRLLHPCKITQDEVTAPGGVGATAGRVHCPLPDGGERVYDMSSKELYDTSDAPISVWTMSTVGSGPYLKYYACFQHQGTPGSTR